MVCLPFHHFRNVVRYLLLVTYTLHVWKLISCVSISVTTPCFLVFRNPYRSVEVA